jgi:hypothetical protein
MEVESIMIVAREGRCGGLGRKWMIGSYWSKGTKFEMDRINMFLYLLYNRVIIVNNNVYFKISRRIYFKCLTIKMIAK